MTVEDDGARHDTEAASRAAAELVHLRSQADGDPLVIANEFAEVHVRKVHTRNGVRLLVESPQSGQWVTIDPLEAEALTWQNQRTFTAMVGKPFGPLFGDDDANADDERTAP